VAYAALAVEQTRLGLGLPLALRPPKNLHDFTQVVVPVFVSRSLLTQLY
jgi:hypothetical protein